MVLNSADTQLGRPKERRPKNQLPHHNGAPLSPIDHTSHWPYGNYGQLSGVFESSLTSAQPWEEFGTFPIASQQSHLGNNGFGGSSFESMDPFRNGAFQQQTQTEPGFQEPSVTRPTSRAAGAESRSDDRRSDRARALRRGRRPAPKKNQSVLPAGFQSPQDLSCAPVLLENDYEQTSSRFSRRIALRPQGPSSKSTGRKRDINGVPKGTSQGAQDRTSIVPGTVSGLAEPVLKRSRLDSENETDGDDDRQKRARQTGPQKFWGCPFYKWRPTQHLNCGEAKLRTPGQVKQHILRTHVPLPRCKECGQPFRGQHAKRDLESHERAGRCLQIPLPPETGLTGDQRLKLYEFKPINRQNHAKAWNKMWEMCIPGEPPPEDPHTRGGQLENTRTLMKLFLDKNRPHGPVDEWEEFLCGKDPTKHTPRDTSEGLVDTLWRSFFVFLEKVESSSYDDATKEEEDEDTEKEESIDKIESEQGVEESDNISLPNQFASPFQTSENHITYGDDLGGTMYRTR